jgi:hypothetical protein
MRLTSGGNLLIGTTTDSGFSLVVSRDANSQTDSNIPGIQIVNEDGAVLANDVTGQIEFFSNDASETARPSGFIKNVAEDPGTKFSLTFGSKNTAADATENMRLTSGGNLLVGTTSDLSAETGAVTISTGDSGAAAGATGYDDLVVEGNGSTGINVLCNSTASNAAGIAFGTELDVNSAFLNFTNSTLEYQIGTSISNGFMTFKTANANEKMRLTSTGNLLIGTTSDGGYDLYIRKQDAAGMQIRLQNTSTSAGANSQLSLVASGNNLLMGANTTVDGNTAWIGPSSSGTDFYIQTQAGEVARFTSTGNLLIGTTTDGGDALYVSGGIGSPDAIFNIQNRYTAGTTYIDFDFAGTTNETSLRFWRDTNTSGAHNLYFYEGDGTATVTAQYVGASGQLILQKSGGGVKLDNLASSDPLVLDSYEEGTWTPVLADAATAGNTGSGTVVGKYTKVGNQVTAQFTLTNMDTTGMTGANDVYIRGLPFTSGDTYIGACEVSSIAFTGYVQTLLGTATYFRLAESASAAGLDYVLVSALTSTQADIRGVITYFV